MRRTMLVVAVAAVALAGAPACSSDDGGNGGGDAGLSSEEWARAVCDAGLQLAEDMRPAVETVESAGSNLDEAGGGGDLDAIVAALDEMEGAMRTMRDGFGEFADSVDDLGAPDVDGGAQFQNELVESLRAAEPAFDQAVELLGQFDEGTTLEDLGRLQEEGQQLSEAFDQLAAPFDSFDEAPGDLGEQFDEVSECKEAEEAFNELEV